MQYVLALLIGLLVPVHAADYSHEKVALRDFASKVHAHSFPLQTASKLIDFPGATDVLLEMFRDRYGREGRRYASNVALMLGLTAKASAFDALVNYLQEDDPTSERGVPLHPLVYVGKTSVPLALGYFANRTKHSKEAGMADMRQKAIALLKVGGQANSWRTTEKPSRSPDRNSKSMGTPSKGLTGRASFGLARTVVMKSATLRSPKRRSRAWASRETSNRRSWATTALLGLRTNTYRKFWIACPSLGKQFVRTKSAPPLSLTSSGVIA